MTAPRSTPVIMRLSETLRACTSEVHRRAERRPFVATLMQARLTLADYARYLEALVPVYESLESGLAQADRPQLTPFAHPTWARRDRLRRDLRALGFAPSAPAAPGVAYGRHLSALAGDRPLGLIGHAYCRYLGDLSGGRILARQAAKIGVPASALTVHAFDAPAAVLIDQFRRSVDALVLDDGERALVEAEARRGFALSIAIFDAIVPPPAPTAMKAG